MLVLSRMEKQSIIVADNIIIEVLEIRRRHRLGDVVRLGITAAPSISIHREEVYEAIQREHAKNAVVANVKDAEPPEMGAEIFGGKTLGEVLAEGFEDLAAGLQGAVDGVNADAYGCHLCRGTNCVDKQCRDSKPAGASVRAGDVPND